MYVYIWWCSTILINKPMPAQKPLTYARNLVCVLPSRDSWRDPLSPRYNITLRQWNIVEVELKITDVKKALVLLTFFWSFVSSAAFSAPPSLGHPKSTNVWTLSGDTQKIFDNYFKVSIMPNVFWDKCDTHHFLCRLFYVGHHKNHLRWEEGGVIPVHNNFM